ncbi:MAG: mechanosensitive ion channel family protein [Bacteroidetes bacterium]|nr:MAG: mechanosensitive ion channel family protein [Bacteroidota bacterium]
MAPVLPLSTLQEAAAPPQQVADSLAAAVDSATASVDSAAGLDSAAADTSLNAIDHIGREVGEAGRLLISGEWELFWTRLYEGLAGLVVSFIPRLLTAIFVLILFYSLYRAVDSVLHRVLHRSRRVDRGLENLLVKTYRIVAWVFISILVLDQFGVNVTALLAGLSIAGIAVGFAARDTLENFISGITILMDKPFRINDFIEVADTYGQVEEITLRSTRIRTLNNQLMVMPNIQMINQKLINHTILGILRVEVPFGIAYKEYPQQAREVVLKLTEGDDRLHPDYPPQVVVTALNDSSVDLSLRLYLADPSKAVPVRFEYIEKIREALREADIEIPFPHLQLFVDEAKAFERSFLMQPHLPVSSASDAPPKAEA